MTSVIKLLATGLGLGYSPVMPGTMGSLLGIGIFLALSQFGLPLWIPIIGLFFFGVIISTKAEEIFNKKDARRIVIDEVAGCIIYLYLVPFRIWYIIIGFIIYRILDIIKPFPAERLQRLHGGWGIMLDDVIAGIYAGLIINIAIWIKNWFL